MAWYHDLNSVLFHLGPLTIKWYGVSYILGFICGYFILWKLATSLTLRVQPVRIADALLVLIFATIAGGRIGYAAIYNPSIFTGFSSSFPFWDLLAIHKGGMASHGGMVGLMLGALYISRRMTDPAPQPLAQVTDALCLAAGPGIIFGRLANFINGELLGAVVAKPGEPGPWWAVRFPQELRDWENATTPPPLTTTPLLAEPQRQALVELVINNARPNETFSSSIANLVSRAESMRPQLEPLLHARHPSQLYSALLEGLIPGIIVAIIALKQRSAGLITGAWLMMYGLGRIAVEFFRLPDAQFANPRPMGLSRGQWLSVGMVMIGAIVIAWVITRARGKKDNLGPAWKASSEQSA
jgi:phosphatidylglycerol---prolipoprotein diacylglyceryl transferase